MLLLNGRLLAPLVAAVAAVGGLHSKSRQGPVAPYPLCCDVQLRDEGENDDEDEPYCESDEEVRAQCSYRRMYKGYKIVCH